MEITGTTRMIAMIGDPISKAKSPSLLNPRLAAGSKDTAVVPFHISADTFEGIFPALLNVGNIDGFIVTYPFKEACIAHVTRLGVSAQLVGGLNAIRREPDGSWTGDIFDGIGLLNAVIDKHNPRNQRVLLIGAGGAGRAIAASFAEAGTAAITIAELDDMRANGLVSALTAAFPDCFIQRGSPLAIGHDIIINATPVGMNPDDGLPGEIGDITPEMTVVDIVPSKIPTALLRKAKAAGATTIAGSAMTEGQATALLRFFGLEE